MGGVIPLKSFIQAGRGRMLAVAYLLLWGLPFAALIASFFSFSGFLQTVVSSRVLSILCYTFVQASISTVVSFAVAIMPAYYAGKHNNAITGVLNSTVFIPFFFPAVSAVIAFSLIFSRNGIIHLLGFDPNIMYTFKGIVIAHVFYNSPLFVRYIGSALQKVPREVIEEATAAGASSLTRFIRVEWPFLAPAAARAALLVFIYSFMSFVIVLSVGGVEFYTIEAEISSVMRSTLDFPYALSLSVLQFLIIGVVAVILGRGAQYELSDVSLSDTSKSPIALFLSLCFILFEYSFVVLGILTCFFDFYTMHFDISGIRSILNPASSAGSLVLQSICNSIIVSSVGGFVSVSIAYLLAKQRLGRSRILLISTVGISSAFLSVGLLYTHIISSFSAVILFGFGCVLNSVPVAYLFLSPHVESFDRSLIEAAQISGAGSWSIFRRIEFPILFSVIASSLLQVWMIIFGEFTIAYTMQIQDVFPLASITAFTLESSHQLKEGTALSGLMICIVLLLCVTNGFIFHKISRRRGPVNEDQ